MKGLTHILLIASLFSTVVVRAQSEANLWAQRAQRKVNAQNQILKGVSIHEQARKYDNNNYEKAIALEEEALAIFRKVKKKDAKRYIGGSLGQLAYYHYSRGGIGDYAYAESYAEEALKYEKKGTEEYVKTLNSLGIYHTAAGHVVKATALNKQLFKQGAKVYGLNTVNYAEILSNQAFQRAHHGNYNDAITYAKAAISIREAVADTIDISFARLLMNTANYYTSREDYRISVEYLNRASVLFYNIEGNNGTNYIDCLRELVSAYNHLGDLEKADNILEKIQGVGSATITEAPSLMKQADVYFNNGDYKMAAILHERVLGIYKQYDDSLGMAHAYNCLSSCYYHGGNTDHAMECGQQAVDIYQKSGGKKTDLAQAFNNMSMCCYYADNVDDALEFSTNALDLYEEAGDTTSSYYAKTLMNAALHHDATGDTDYAITHTLKAYNLLRSMFGEEHPDNVTSLFNLAYYYYKKDVPQKVCDYFHQALQLQSIIVKENFSHLSTEGRERYWNTKKYVFSVASIYAYLFENQDSLLLDTYNAQLFTKGILLNSEVDFKKLLRQSGDDSLLEKLTDIEILGQQINNIYNMPTSEEDHSESHKQEIEFLKLKKTTLERELMRNCKEYGDYTANMNISADSIAASLQTGEVAVELFEIETENGKAYYAMYLKKGWEVPRLVKMFSYHDLRDMQYNGKDFNNLFADSASIEYIFNEGRIGQMVWNPLIQSWGDDVQTIYLSPSGLFYKWGIEYLMMGDRERIDNKYNIYRLSSTKLLAQRQTQRPIVNVALYGGFEYDLSPDDMSAIHEGYIDENNEMNISTSGDVFAMRSSIFDFDNLVADSLASRGGSIKRLKGAKEEVDNIELQLIQHDISTEKFTDNGIEENFKALNGKSHSIVHVATHGFSIGEHNESDRKKYERIMGISRTILDSNADLHYSGLLFSGANNVINGKKLPQGIDDGILTSYEISNLNLGKVDMVVLSACETGLGTIKEDGVFGLQRGFKKAGVQTLMMSLWEVRDLATRNMMTCFYQSLMEGLSRHEAFKKARSQMRTMKDVPYYWASFIMLDDI